MRSEKLTFTLPVDGLTLTVKKYIIWGHDFYQVDYPNTPIPIVLTKAHEAKQDSWISLTHAYEHISINSLGAELNGLQANQQVVYL